jgi:hypothetical protein
MKNYLILIFVAITLFCCSSKSEETPIVDDSVARMLVASPWTIYEVWLDPDQNGEFEKGELPECEGDNRHIFNENGTFTYDTGENVCDSTQMFILSGKWEILEGNKKLLLTDLPEDMEYIIISIATQEVVLRPITRFEPDGSLYQRLILRR